MWSCRVPHGWDTRQIHTSRSSAPCSSRRAASTWTNGKQWRSVRRRGTAKGLRQVRTRTSAAFPNCSVGLNDSATSFRRNAVSATRRSTACCVTATSTPARSTVASRAARAAAPHTRTKSTRRAPKTCSNVSGVLFPRAHLPVSPARQPCPSAQSVGCVDPRVAALATLARLARLPAFPARQPCPPALPARATERPTERPTV